MRLRSLIAGAALVLAGNTPALAQQTELQGSIFVELNRLESIEGACRVYFLIENQTEVLLRTFQLDVYIFDQDGVIARRLAFDTPQMPSGSPRVRVLDLADIGCPNIGRMLLNGALLCEDETGERDDCESAISVRSRAEAPFDF